MTAVLTVAVLVCPLTAQADVIWEPEDSFWESHQDDCKYLGRNYRTSGEVKVYKSPENDKAVKTLDAGVVFWSYYTYTDVNGNEWTLYCWDDETGWIPKVYLETVYDYVSFANEYGDQIREESGTVDEKYLEEQIYFWNYPGAATGGELPRSKELPEYEKVFTDEYGHEWGFLNYWYGHKNVWVCLDGLTSDLEQLYEGEFPERGVKIDGEEPVVVEKLIDPAEVEKVVPAESGSNLLVNSGVILCVLGVIIITAVILRAMKKKNNGRQQ